MASTPVNTVALVSGGLDSCVALAWAFENIHGDIKPVHFSYGQTHEKEFAAAAKIAEHYGYQLESHVLNFTHIVPGEVGHLLKKKHEFDPLAAGNTVKDKEGEDVSATFVPGRNIIFLAYAGSIADSIKAMNIVIGVNAVDYSGYPDCRPDFVKAMQAALSHGLRGTIAIHAPLIHLTKAEIIKKGVALRAPLEYTWSCYTGGVTPCGVCPSCQVREKGFHDAGMIDPWTPQ